MARLKGPKTKIVRLYEADVAVLEQIRRGIVVCASGQTRGIAEALADVLTEALSTGAFEGYLEAGQIRET